MLSPIEQFRDALAVRGITPESVIADGQLQYCPADNKAGNGRYLLHLDESPAGGFINHSDGLGWQKRSAKVPRRKSTPAEAKAQAERRAAQQEHRGGCEAVRHAQAAGRASELWGRGKVAWEHDYLDSKKVRQHGLKVLDGVLLVPVRIGGALTSLQTIDATGRKLFLPSGSVMGGYHTLGKPKVGGRVYIAEGFATGASVHEATGVCTVVAFSAGNLLPAARGVLKAWPSVRLVFAADNDANGVGLAAATAAATAVGGTVICPEALGDFNDMAQRLGLKAVRETLNAG